MSTYHIYILHLQPMVYWVVILLHHIHTLLPQSVVRWVVILLHLIRTLHHIHTIDLNLFTLKMVTTRVDGKHLPYISSSVKDEEKNEWTHGDEKKLILLNFII
jgi:hypothetical protein